MTFNSDHVEEVLRDPTKQKGDLNLSDLIETLLLEENKNPKSPTVS